MDYQEKLRLAKEALDSGSYDKETIEYIFPELKESEDERIRKNIISRLKNIKGQTIPINDYNSAITWLEKQAKQKTEIKYIYPKFRVGDVIEPVKPNGYAPPVRVKYIGEGNYSCESDDCKSFLSFPICKENEYVLTEQEPTWSEEDEKTLNTVIEKGDLKPSEIKWLKSLKERYSWN